MVYLAFLLSVVEAALEAEALEAMEALVEVVVVNAASMVVQPKSVLTILTYTEPLQAKAVLG
jgi:hypothetical protein